MPKVVHQDDLIKRAKKTFKYYLSYWEELFNEMIDDLKFGNGEQWPTAIKVDRESDGRPCLRINKMPQFVDKVQGDMRQNRPMIKIRPVDDKSDPETADILTGLIKNIEVQSDAEMVYDSGGEAMVRCGYGAWRVVTDYVADDSFDQKIVIQRIKNQFAVLLDPYAKKWDRSDGRAAFIYEDMPRSTFKKRFPKATPLSFEEGKEDNWSTEDTIRVAEFFERDTEASDLYMVQIEGEETPRIVTKLPDKPHDVLKHRKVQKDTITWYRISGNEILEGPIELRGKYIPIVPVYGKETNIEGNTYYNGIIRHAKDSQRLYNYFRSMDAETIALAPKAPWIMTAAMLGPHKSQWKTANKRNYAYLLYTPDPKVPGGRPERNIPQLSNQAIIQQVMIADQELHDTTGLQLASLGKKSNEQSGRAIEARAMESDTGQYTYNDNLVRSIKHTAKIILDLIPYIYDTARVERIIGEDDNVKTVPINQAFNDQKDNGKEKLFDVTVGKYDVVASVGPSYQTQRQESLSAMLDFVKILDPQQRMAISDQIAASSDWHNSDLIAARLKRTVPPNVIGPEENPEDQEPPNPAELKAQAMQESIAEVELETKEVELTIKKAELKKTEAEAAEAEADAAIAEAKATVIAKGYSPEIVEKAM